MEIYNTGGTTAGQQAAMTDAALMEAGQLPDAPAGAMQDLSGAAIAAAMECREVEARKVYLS